MVKQVYLEKLHDCPRDEYLGREPRREDVDVIYHEDVDVYLPSGELAIVFRVGALKSTLPVSKGGTLTPENLKYWQWASKRPPGTDQRGFAAGKEIVTFPEVRLTLGQWEFFTKATRQKNPLVDEEEAREILKNTGLSRNTFYLNKTESDGLVDVEEIKKWHDIVRKVSIQGAERVEATEKRNKAKLAWFDKWFEEFWVPAEDRVAVATAARNRYVSKQPRGNMAFSTVLGVMDRAGRLPYGRLTVPTEKRWADFEANAPFFQEVNEIFRQTMPKQFEVLNERFSKVKDPRYNLFGTVFTSITCNFNFQVKYHVDGNNAKNAVAALWVMEDGEYSGGEFVFPELRIGFDIREGDVFIGDNQSLIHGQLPFGHDDMRWGNYGHKPSAVQVMGVLYQRDRVITLEDLECENCRKDFLAYSVIHHQDKGTGEPKWAGSWPGQFQSEEWMNYKKMRGLERCENSNHLGT